MVDVDILRNRLEQYRAASIAEEDHAMREILQEYVLAALTRTDFFAKAAFHGGTHLRIFHGLRRFSEDLDFALLSPNVSFELKPYLNAIKSELVAIGLEVEVADKAKGEAQVKKAFVKEGSLVRLLSVQYHAPRGGRSPRKLQIKIEVDANPPAGVKTEMKLLRFPFRAAVANYDLPSSFSGKLHALLCRPYVKGRDWYDFDWYAGNRVAPNIPLLSSAIFQNGPWEGMQLDIDAAWIRREMIAKITSLDWKAAKEDLEPFVREEERGILDSFNAQYFTAIAEELFR